MTDVTGQVEIDTVHPTVTSIVRVPESDTGLPGGDTNADVLVYRVNMSQAIDGSTIDGGDFGIYARDLNNSPITIDDATLTVRSGAAADAAVVTAGEHTEVYVHVQSVTLAGLDGPLSCGSRRWIRYRSRRHFTVTTEPRLSTGARSQIGIRARLQRPLTMILALMIRSTASS